jgi:eukaryotic-like serine/threonine-protein kinase
MAQLFNKRYEIQERLGEGGMGAVYRALDRLTGETVALKVVLNTDSTASTSEAQTEDADFHLSLAKEFKVMASLRHPHIISVLDYGFGTFNHTRQPYLAMELLEKARDFSEYGAELETLEAKIELALQLLQAMAYLHRRNILHRDIKPANVLLNEEKQLKVLDFGLAMETGTEGIPAGTLLYMAPELLAGGDPSVASDLYAIGVMVYELLTGRNPFSRPAPWETINAVLNDEPDLAPVELLATKRASRLKPFLKPTSQDAQDKTVSHADDALTRIHQAADTKKTPLRPMRPVRFADTTDIQLIGGTALPDILARLLTKQPENRYQSAEAVIQALCSAVELPLPEETKEIRESFLQAATFVGRKNEIDQLTAALLNTLALPPVGSLWLIGGESGVGKSRLLEELRILAMVRGAAVIRGQAEAEAGAPYQLWREPLRRLVLMSEPGDLDAAILKDLVPDIETLLGRKIPDAVRVDRAAYQQRLHGTIASLFQQQPEPLVVLLDDLHHASTEDLELLRVINRLAGSLPLLIVTTYRSDERPALAKELEEMKPLRLERFTSQEVAALSRSMLGAAGERPDILTLLERETEGNIFFMIEILRALSEEAGRLEDILTLPLPQSIATGGMTGVIERRLSRVAQRWLPLLKLAAVAGRKLDLSVLKPLHDGGNLQRWLLACATASVLELREGEWQFTYDRLREAVIDTIPAAERPALHRRVALAVEQIYPNAPEHAAALANHWQAAGELEKEFAYIRQAADYALRISVFADAVAHLTRALGLVRAISLDDSLRDTYEADIMVKLGETLYYTGDYTTAITRLEAALRLFRALNDAKGTARALNAMGDTRWRLGQYPEAVSACEEALRLSKGIDDQESIARALNRLGMVLTEQGSYVEAAARLNESAQVARALNMPGLIVSPVNNLAVVAFAQGDYDSAERYLEETLALSRLSGERYKTAAVLANLGSVAGSREAFQKAMTYFEESLSISQTIGYRHGVGFALKNLGILAEMQQDYATAERYLKQGLELSQAMGERQSSAMTLISLGEVASLQNQPGDALQYYRQALKLAEEIESIPTIMDAFVGIAKITDNEDEALELLGLVLNHPAAVEDTRRLAEPILEALRAALPPDRVEAALVRGRARELQQMIAQVMKTPA